MAEQKQNDGANQAQPGGGQSGGGKWPGKNDAPAQGDVTTHNVTENKPARDED